MNRTILRRSAALSTLAAVVALAGCESMSEREKGTAQGAAHRCRGRRLIGAATGGSAGQSAVIGGAVGAVAGNLWSKNMEDKRKAMEAATAGTGIEVARTPDNQLKVNVPSDLSFDIGRAEIKPALRPVLDQFAQGLDTQDARARRRPHRQHRQRRHQRPAVGAARHERAQLPVQPRRVDPARTEVQGRGSREPVADNTTDAGRAMNRRVEIFLSEPAA